MKKITVALLSGGDSPEREVSLSSGDQVYDALEKEKYDILRYDPKTDLQRLMADANKIDVALIILHGPNGEDGTIQGLLDLLKIPYQGSGVLGSANAMNKIASKHLYAQFGIPTPSYLTVKKTDTPKPDQWIRRLGLPLVVKPVSCGSSVGLSIVKSEDMLAAAVEKAFCHDDTIMLEEYIEGIELTVGVIGNDSLEALPVIEIIPDDAHEFFDYEAKYTAGITQEICPARIDDNLTEKAQSLGKLAHRALFCKGYSRTDMILRQKDIFVLETNTIPGMTANSLLPQAAKTAGISFSKLLDKLIELGMEGHRR
ncbi:MAG: D-alanine--D-alanine ligase [Deltaproteobacteria bacterium]|nr:D-alanine--D-alanine ligase [Deltaproteobacteria bacterium]MBW1961297.1 D-alanine--D-alanine ligase [Deltaproteobacteria bacterium]MBW1993591.1 D-alanine--D-alanine ligase [Deltaproteobacteria bacterium]MBW2152446.1 D-alanine--D-alanine ligase [Deltaproteobacteria bacterium]